MRSHSQIAIQSWSCTARQSAALVVIATIIVLLSGCGGQRSLGEGQDRTGGIVVELFVERADHAAAYYRVTADGAIGFGGAQDARRRDVSWTGSITDEQIDQLHRILYEHDLLTGQPDSTDNADDPTYHVTIRSAEGRNRIRTTGANPSLDELHRFLREASRQRFDRILDTLPQPEQR